MPDYVVSTRAIKGGSFSSEPGPTRFLRIPDKRKPNPTHEINRTTFITDVVVTPQAQKCENLVVFVHGYPDETINAWDMSPESIRDHLVCVQSVFVDEQDFLWFLDPASPLFNGVVAGGAKLLKANLASNTIERTYHFDEAVAPAASYLNDVRIANGYAFISDSGLGAIVVVDLTSAIAVRRLAVNNSTKAEPGVEPIIGERQWKFGGGSTPQVNGDDIAIDPQRQFFSFRALTGRMLNRVPVAALVENQISSADLGAQVEKVANAAPTDGIEFDANGNLYLTVLERNAICVLRPSGQLDFAANSREFKWPDTLYMPPNGTILFTSTQFHRMPAFNGQINQHQPPYKILRVPKTQSFPFHSQ